MTFEDTLKLNEKEFDKWALNMYRKIFFTNYIKWGDYFSIKCTEPSMLSRITEKGNE